MKAGNSMAMFHQQILVHTTPNLEESEGPATCGLATACELSSAIDNSIYTHDWSMSEMAIYRQQSAEVPHTPLALTCYTAMPNISAQ